MGISLKKSLVMAKRQVGRSPLRVASASLYAIFHGARDIADVSPELWEAFTARVCRIHAVDQ
jgi:hypothetical protein